MAAPVFARTMRELPTLHTARLTLRQLRRDDVDAVYEYTSDPQVTQYTIWDLHRTREDTRHFLDSLSRQQEIGRSAMWGIEESASGKLIGNCGFGSIIPEHARAELSFALNRQFWGKGYMSEAAHAAVQAAFNRLGINRVEALSDGENAATVRVLKRVGMIFEGIMRQGVRMRGAFRDAKVYSVLKSEFR
jgi:[ribosomal protein S5]-alanine N-acetyltransferase